jgi:transposase-like protein
VQAIPESHRCRKERGKDGPPAHEGTSRRGRGTSKAPVFCAVERQGQIRRRIVAKVTTETIERAIRQEVDRNAHLMTDEFSAYHRIGPEFASHTAVCHATKEYASGTAHTNTAESSHALVKRGIAGIYHNVSCEYLHRYLWHFDFLWNNRKMNYGERTVLAIREAEGKRLMYREPNVV